MTDIAPSRECGNCTACCEGWLHGVVRGKEMYRGKPCHFLGCNRCTIYEERPIEPCRNFNCVWLMDQTHELPEWMKPELSKVIIKELEYEVEIRQGGFGSATYILENAANLKTKSRFWYVTECGETISGPVLNWLIQYALEKDIPMLYQVMGRREVLGPPEFHAWARQYKDRPIQKTK